MRMIPTAATALLALLLSACATSRHDSSSAAADPAPVLLVSLDGFHPRYLGQGRTPTLDALADGGVRAEWMTPSYPSLTFPNHYTLVTGLRPDRHGVVHNTMWDEALGRLMDGLRAAGLDDTVNIVVTSDHGMATVRPGQVVIVEDMVDEADARLVTTGQSVGFAPLPGRTAQAETQLLGRHDHYECWRKGELPARWHYGTHPRVPAIVCQMDEGWDAIKRDWAGSRPSHARGSHGFDPTLASMRALFIAHGPAFRPGAVLPPIENVDVYPLLARLVGVPAAPNDGDAEALLPALSATSP